MVEKQDIPILITIIFSIARNGTQLLSITTEHLRIECVFPATTITQRLHYGVYFLLEHFGELQFLFIKKINIFGLIKNYLPWYSIYIHEMFFGYTAKHYRTSTKHHRHTPTDRCTRHWLASFVLYSYPLVSSQYRNNLVYPIAEDRQVDETAKPQDLVDLIVLMWVATLVGVHPG